MNSRISLAMLFAAGCHLRTTDPHAMGAAQHEAHAKHETDLAHEHDAQSDDADRDTQAKCDRARFGPCWSAAEQHAGAAEHHRELAARHRAASASLRDAEARACAGLDDADRDESPFAHGADIGSVSPIEESFPKGNDRVPSRLVGAQITFRPLAGMTVDWLDQAVACHIARNAAIGHARASEDMPYCPLTLAGAGAAVSSTADGIAVAITSEDPAIASEILRRAQSLVESR